MRDGIKTKYLVEIFSPDYQIGVFYKVEQISENRGQLAEKILTGK